MGRPRELSEEQRAELVAKGFTAAEIWVPDWSNPVFRARLRDEARRIAELDAYEPDIDEWVVQARGNLWDDEPE